MIFLLTNHVLNRIQQRKIPYKAIELTIKYGQEIYYNLTYKYTLNGKAIKQIQNSDENFKIRVLTV